VLHEADQPFLAHRAKRPLDRLPTAAIVISMAIPIK
jgi:hypothetical protein